MIGHSFHTLHVNPHVVAAHFLAAVPDATQDEIEQATAALYGRTTPLFRQVVSFWRVARYERDTGFPF